MALLDDIKEVVVEQLSVNPDEVKEESKFVDKKVDESWKEQVSKEKATMHG